MVGKWRLNVCPVCGWDSALGAEVWGERLGVGPVYRMSPGLVSVSVRRENAAGGQQEQAARGQRGDAAAGPASGREGGRGSGLGATSAAQCVGWGERPC